MGTCCRIGEYTYGGGKTKGILYGVQRKELIEKHLFLSMV